MTKKVLFRMIQMDRQHRTMGVHPQFRRQDRLLRSLKKEYTNLNKDLKVARSGRHKKNDKKMKMDLERGLLLRMKSEFDCDRGFSIMDELDGLLQQKAKEMLRLRKLTNANQGELDARRSQSEYRLMSAENKLEAAMLRFNTVQCENKKIRKQIEHMLIDRTRFNQAWGKMLNALITGKKFLSDLFESSNLAYDQRDDWCYKLRSIQEKGKLDQMLQVQEMRDLQRAYDHEMKIYNFLAKKGVKRVNKKEEQREAERKRVIEEQNEKQFTKHLKILHDINDYTRESNYTKIIKDFEKVEFENFAVYKLITEFCAENEILSRDLKNIRQEIEDRRDFNEQNAAKQDRNLANLHKQVEKQKRKTEQVRREADEQDQLLNNTMGVVQEMFQMLDCSLEPYQNLLGDKQPTLHTLKMSLMLITEKIKEYVEVVCYSERCQKRREVVGSKTMVSSRSQKYTVRAEPPVIFTPIPLSLLVPSDPCPSCIETRWMSRVSETPETPFNQDQARAALVTLARDPAYMRNDRVHALADCRATASRRLLATRHEQY